MDNHFKYIKKYIDDCDKIKILLCNKTIVKNYSNYHTKKSYIDKSSETLVLSGKDPFIKLISEEILESNKNIMFKFDNAIAGGLFYYEKFNVEYIKILHNAHTIRTYRHNNHRDDEKYLENIILKNDNLRKLKIGSLIKINNDICNALQNKFLRYIEINDYGNTDWNNIYKIIKLKSLNRIYINFYYENKKNCLQIIKIIDTIIKDLEKNIEIMLSIEIIDELLNNIDYSRIVLCNFKIEIQKRSKYRTLKVLKYNYIPRKFKTFENFYNFNFIYKFK